MQDTAAASPLAVRRQVTMRRIRNADKAARYTSQRRQAAIGKGYHGPLTREELARKAARASR